MQHLSNFLGDVATFKAKATAAKHFRDGLMAVRADQHLRVVGNGQRALAIGADQDQLFFAAMPGAGDLKIRKLPLLCGASANRKATLMAGVAFKVGVLLLGLIVCQDGRAGLRLKHLHPP
ncbi:MAG: hypothetical protein K0S07_121 [Chlamydiales bacterium]|nr:hypothetical protein [Chlamydiales bacterium]